MTAYTVGHTASYNDALLHGYASGQGFPVGSRPKKIGRSDDLYGDGTNISYRGGCVFQSRADARRYLVSIEKTDIWSVYEIDADWTSDCYELEGEPFRRLRRDCAILRKVRDDEDDSVAPDDAQAPQPPGKP